MCNSSQLQFNDIAFVLEIGHGGYDGYWQGTFFLSVSFISLSLVWPMGRTGRWECMKKDSDTSLLPPLLQCPNFGKHLLSSPQLLPGRPTPTDSSLTKDMVTLFHPWLFSPRVFLCCLSLNLYKSTLHCPWLSNWYLH